jgi:hypothetical protein
MAKSGWKQTEAKPAKGSRASSEPSRDPDRPKGVTRQALEKVEKQMADNPKKRGKLERKKASAQPHEIEYLMKKFKVSRQAVVGARRAVGNNRTKVEAYLKQR